MTMEPTTAPTLPDATTVKEYILYLGGRDQVDDIDQFKVQAILYFYQGWSLALRARPLFSDDVQAWRHGPVVPNIHRQLTDWGADPIPPVPSPQLQRLNEEDRAFIESVWEDCRSMSGKALKDYTHQPGPWTDVWGNRPSWASGRDEIPRRLMAQHFAKKVRAWRGRN